MRITHCHSHLLHLPGATAGGPERIAVLLVHLDTDSALRGLGFAYTIQGTGRALHAVAVEDITPLLLAEDPLDHEKLAAKVYWRLQTIGRRGLVAQAYSAFDLALWDLKGKVAGLPLFKLLGGAREVAPAFAGNVGWPDLELREILDAVGPHLDRGLMGMKLHLKGDPETDADRVQQLRESLGEDVWLAVDAGQRYDYGTALAMGHFFEEEIGADWFENPVLCEDVRAHARLATKLELPLAIGSALFGREEFEAYSNCDAATVLRPDVTRLGGLTTWLKVAAVAEQRHLQLAPHLLPEVGVHLACGLPSVTIVEHVDWLTPLWQAPLQFDGGKLAPPRQPGLGLEVIPEMMDKYRARV